VALVARDTYSGVVNLSLNETLMRSVNTSLVVVLPILSLLLFGGATLKDFAFALFVGVVSGAYSSIFIASPVLALLKEREPRYQAIRTRAMARVGARTPAGRTPAARSPATRRALQAVPGGRGAAEPVAEPPGEPRPAARPAPGAQRAGGTKPKPKRKTTAAKRRRR
jgi:Protein export membrane protein